MKFLSTGDATSCLLCPMLDRLPTWRFVSASIECFYRLWCLYVWLCPFVAQWIVLWATHGLPFRASLHCGCPCCDPPVCPDTHVGITAERQPFVVVGVWSCQCLVRTLPNKFNVISPFPSSRVTALLLYVFRVPCLTTSLDAWSLECANTCTPARRAALFCEYFVTPTASAGCGFWVFFSMKSFFQQILIDMLFISVEITSHYACLLPAMPLSILFTPDADPLHSQEMAPHRMLSGTAAPSAALEKLPHRSCGESCYDVVHVPCVDFLLQELRSQTGTYRRCTTVQPRTSLNPALDLGCLVLDSSFS